MPTAPFPLLTRSRKTLALAGAGALIALAASPGAAAAPVAQADATALVLTVLSTPADSGTVKATHDGADETVVGQQNPLITALGNQSFINAGTLAQDATASVVDRRGRSAACAGLAGDGATLVSVDRGFCLDPGDNATINAGTLQLQDVQVVQSDLLAGLDQTLQAALQPLLGTVLPTVDSTLQTVLTGIGDPGIVLDLGAVQSQCAATTNGATGDSQLTDAGLYVDLPTIGRVDLVNLPTNPPPNTKVVTDLDVVVTAISDAVETELTTALTGVLAPAAPLVDQLVTALNANVIAVLADQLAPLEDNVLDATLNKQTRGDRSIEVTALDVRVLPAASAFVDLVNVEIGRSSCGPNGRVAVDNPTPTPTPDPTDPTPAVPTSVPAGELDLAGGATSSGDLNGRIATGGLVLMSALAAACGVYGFRRVLRS
ncbi:hypothetical protein [Nocardioides rubriscoriae]|uniref:hypothetical protein n=1 Tax=Nocardioides rubriscoriae TaxID=642762 RepID=UPI0011DFC929|nr:hypothetical protein [Nocardioides rubriscoriae]